MIRMMKMLRKKRVLLLLFLGMLFLLFVQSQWLGKWMYPIAYEEEIRKHAAKYDIDPLLVAAIIRVETNFQAGRESRKGAIGVMQLMPETATWAMEQLKMKERWSLNELKNTADPNILIGTWYLKSLHKQFNENWIAAIAAYNAGPGNVSKWIRTKIWDGRYETAKQRIPYGETKLYVQRVIHYYDKYKGIYSK
ncbi:lytic transglycosylase domain-containing protein [Paenibacillus alvei]|uniref:Lytic transglycosylase domain-containing protein n=1 Tax=Paenibacillus alvei TaxID=44250 RepID=A0ABT4GZE9_PAEAL|nr:MULTISPECIES: lytic transglycosylase domain-containing protein [Paenibacillus]EJW14555.1 lytic transglycosylase catalytic [Paenibacillus alvei DSM 29]MCY9542951.1 lytic transglycosylase domain-containing protein [Paenibacillus alvei]MCY9737139.1 lytic transglycosylase domain-containing protein [Paenibacillus alvei]MCY9757586.1 lytic transglycosylase domain-containing protein [Paenibacillus alvei]MCY9762079.1 lytic transglycosylase domain-containing protein [Paenibacillus alvei]